MYIKKKVHWHVYIGQKISLIFLYHMYEWSIELLKNIRFNSSMYEKH